MDYLCAFMSTIQEALPLYMHSLWQSQVLQLPQGGLTFKEPVTMAAAFNCAPARPLKTSGWVRTQITCLNTGCCHVSAVIILSFW